MSAAEFQAYLARIYTDSSFRALFYSNAGQTFSEYELADEERAAVLLIDRSRLDFFAASLKAKRLKLLRRAYPALFALAEPSMARYLDRFHNVYPKRPGVSRQQDIADFGMFMEKTLFEAPGVSQYAHEVARYERIVQAIGIQDGGPSQPAAVPLRRLAMRCRPHASPDVAVESFECLVTEFTEALRTGHGADSVKLEPEILVVVRGRDLAVSRILKVSPPTAYVLELCNGFRTLGQIATRVESHFAHAGLATDVAHTVAELERQGAVEISS